MSDAIGQYAEPARHARSDTRERILYAAIELFGGRGFELTTMRELASAVGIKAPAIYNHFASKEEILNAAIESAMQDFSRYVIGPDNPHDLPAKRLEGIVMRHVSFQLVHSQVAKAFDMFMYSPAHGKYVSEQARDRIRQLLKQYVDVVSDIVRQVSRNIKPREVRMCAIAITDMCDTVPRWYRADGKYSPEKVGRFYWLMIRKIVDL